MSLPPIGRTVHLVTLDQAGDPLCVDAQVTAHCKADTDETFDCVHLRELTTRRQRLHMAYGDGADGPEPDTWHRVDEHR